VLELYPAPPLAHGRVKRGNWIQPDPNKGVFVILRLYSPLEPFFDKSWRPSEVELVRQATRLTKRRRRPFVWSEPRFAHANWAVRPVFVVQRNPRTSASLHRYRQQRVVLCRMGSPTNRRLTANFGRSALLSIAAIGRCRGCDKILFQAFQCSPW